MSSRKNIEPTGDISPLEEVTALKELIAVVVDYYCFENNDFNENGDAEESFLPNTDNNDSSEIIPEEIDDLIDEVFKNQLKKFL